jgi:hypothetical protein
MQAQVCAYMRLPYRIAHPPRNSNQLCLARLRGCEVLALIGQGDDLRAEP